MDTITNPISEILSRLMFEKRIRTAELARRIKLPQPTVHRIVTGTSPKPHISSLIPLAEFFGISVEQLKGLDPIPWLATKDNNQLIMSGWKELPLLSWDEVLTYHQSSKSEDYKAKQTLFCDANVGPRSFILEMNDASMSPQFPIGTLLVINPDKPIKDRSFIVACVKNSPTALFRQLLIDGPNYYIKPLSPDFDHFRMTLLNPDDVICGSLAQIRVNFTE